MILKNHGVNTRTKYIYIYKSECCIDPADNFNQIPTKNSSSKPIDLYAPTSKFYPKHGYHQVRLVGGRNPFNSVIFDKIYNIKF
jgi:hypothetical protein